MSRTTPPKEPERRRAADAWTEAQVSSALTRAMERAHKRNPAKYHKDRPLRPFCEWDPKCPFTKGATQ